MFLRVLMIIVAVLVATAVSAETFETGPVIENYGPVIAVAEKDVEVDVDRRYRLVFDAAAYPGSPGEVNVELETVARFINMHAINGVPLDNMELAVVVHGEALQSVLEDSAYRRRHGVGNPSLELLGALAEQGVQIYVCGQSMGFRDVTRVELAGQVQVALSAMTMLSTLQADGFALIP